MRDDSVEAVGAALARRRRAARLTGQALGDMVGMSQAKISRIETGQTIPSPADVVRIARALHIDPGEIDRLVAAAERAQNRMTDWRQASGSVGGIQPDVTRVEAKTGEFRIFQPNLVVGLGQTSEYAHAVLSKIDPVYGTPSAEPRLPSVAAALAERMRRQVVLADTGRDFHFVMAEGALGARIAEPVHMLAQIAHLRKLSRQENVHLRIIPADIELPLPLIHGFELLDSSWVFVDVFNTAMASQGREDVLAYRKVFDALEQAATETIDPILDRYRAYYRKLDP